MLGQPTNDDHATWAAAALEAFTATQGGRYADEPLEDRVGDLLCDLLHLARRDASEKHTLDEPTDLLDRARSNFEEEEEEETGGEEGTEDDEEDDDPDSNYNVCSGETCDTSVHRDDAYFATPCGTFCDECMTKHMQGCGVCAAEFAK